MLFKYGIWHKFVTKCMFYSPMLANDNIQVNDSHDECSFAEVPSAGKAGDSLVVDASFSDGNRCLEIGESIIACISNTRKHTYNSKFRGVNYENRTKVSVTNCVPGSFLHAGVLNASSVRNTSLSIADLIIDQKQDIFALTVTWLRGNVTDNVVIGEMVPLGYSIFSVPRKDRVGGGVALIAKDILSIKLKPTESYGSFEYMETEVRVAPSAPLLRFVVVYSPKPKANDNVASDIFIEDFSGLLDHLAFSPSPFFIVGDFNYHFEIQQNVNTSSFSQLLDVRGLRQHVLQPTHDKGHTLDLVITKSDLFNQIDISVDRSVTSDHWALLFRIPVQGPIRSVKRSVTVRKWKSITIPDLKQDILESNMNHTVKSNATDALIQYNNVLDGLMNKHAPSKVCNIYVRPKSAWYGPEIIFAKQVRRKAEHCWRRTRSTADHRTFQEQRNVVRQLLVSSRQQYFRSKFENCADQKELFKLANDLLNSKGQVVLPDHTSQLKLAEQFQEHFSTKVEKMRSAIQSGCQNSDFVLFQPRYLGTKLAVLNHASVSEVSQFKLALVRPLLKKVDLERDDFRNYRPVSNLSFVSKVLERAVASRLLEHQDSCGLRELFHSAYIKNHSVETALTRIHNDLCMSVDRHGAALLILLDLSAAFDTIDHGVLLRRLQDQYGVEGGALAWVDSYLRNRRQCIVIGDHRSQEAELTYGVQQGSVLGPLLFSAYVSPLGELILSYGLQFHSYADDTQVYVSFNPRDPESIKHAVEKVEQCLAHVRLWMAHNFLKLNEEKTEIIGN